MSQAEHHIEETSLTRLYFRALGLLGSEIHVAIFLAFANFALAAGNSPSRSSSAASSTG